ncbi:MAG: hypothetical protein GY773_18030, partial [Actinomycetia bacterium]|nr:hypothetical protein [Actinomycetes bacterium]
MTANDFTRAPRTTLNGAINNSVTTINITSATGWQTPGDNYYAKVWAASGDQFLNFLDGETVTVTALAGAALTVTRGEDDTTAASWSDGDHIMVVGPAEILQEHNDHA